MAIEGVLRPIIASIVSLALILLLCEFGETVVDRFELVDDKLCQCEWYLFPVGMQKPLAIFMLFTQQPVMIRGFANVRCVRETFKKVNLDYGESNRLLCDFYGKFLHF